MPSTSQQEQQRIAALEHYDILDTPAEKQFDDLVKLAAEICGVPIALISLVDAKRQWFKAKVGIDAPETPRDISACQYAIQRDGLMVVSDTLLDERFVANPLVTGDPHMRFYAGAPLSTPEGHRIGTLCVLDREPRQLTAGQKAALETLSAQVVTLLELRLALKEKKRTEMLLREHIAFSKKTSERYKFLFESINQGFCVIEMLYGADGRASDYLFVEMNPAFEKQTGIADGKGQTIRTLVPEIEDSWITIYDQVAKTREPARFTQSSPVLGRWFDVYAFPVDDVAGNRVAIIFDDITERHRYQSVLLDARNAAESANMAKTEFLANMSHEIRTPMNAIMGLSTILAMSQPLTEKQRQFVKTLQMSADSMLSLINDLLDIAKIEARTVELEQIPFNLTQIIQEVISMMAVRVSEKGLKFTSDGENVKDLIFIGDPTRLRQMLLNLCSNAIKFTDKGGIHVSIHVLNTSDPEVDTICISVKDTGIGIAQDKLATIFDKFIQADSSINRKYGGTGLGLAITKTIAEIMGGTVKVESVEGKGSTFVVCVPLRVASDVQADMPSAVQAVQQPQGIERKVLPHILLVEDYAPNVLVASTILEGFGYVVDVAGDGNEALEKFKSSQYVAVLMDVQMHGMNGLEATRAIRLHENQHDLPRVPIIGMTAHALSGDRERCMGSGMDEYIPKPFNPADLRQKLEMVTETAQ